VLFNVFRFKIKNNFNNVCVTETGKTKGRDLLLPKRRRGRGGKKKRVEVGVEVSSKKIKNLPGLCCCSQPLNPKASHP